MRSAAAWLPAAVLLALTLPAAAAPPSGGLDPGRALTQYSVDAWTTEDGLPGNTVTALEQTRDGYLWLGTYDGLARFDGVAFTTFRAASTEGLGPGGVLSLLEDRGGTLWVGTNGGGVSRYAAGRFSTSSSADGLPGDIVRCLYEDRQGSVWIGTNQGLARWREGTLTSFGADQGLGGVVVRAIAEDAQGTLWVGTSGSGLLRLAGERFVPLQADRPLPSRSVFSLLCDRQGALWIGTNGGGLARLSGNQLQVFTRRDGLPSDILWALHEDAGGILWAGTYGGGLARRRGETFESYASAQGLPSDLVRCLLPDREGSLWIGTYNGGLVRLRDGKFHTYTTREGLSHDLARAVFETRGGALWVGTTGGGLCSLEADRFRCLGDAGLDVRALAEDASGSLLVGTSGRGLFWLRDGRLAAHPLAGRVGSLDVSALATQGENHLWVGTNGGGLVRLGPRDTRRFTRRDGLGSDFVMAVLADRSGRMWVGTDGGGVSLLEGGTLTTFTREHGLGADVVLCLYQDRQGVVWAGTSGGGLSRLEGKRFRTITSRQGLHDDVVFGIVEDARGDFWLSGNKGVSRLSRTELQALAAGSAASVQPTVFGTADGMKSGECSGIAQPSVWRRQDGRLVFPTARGIAVIDPADIRRNPLPPPVQIERLVVDGRDIPLAAPVAVPPGRERWEVHFTALSFLAPRKVRFRYRLEGYDTDWLDPGARRTAFYTRLPPGDYTFRVVASNDDGVWNQEGAALPFRVQPRFRETGLFSALLASGLVALLAGAVHLRLRSLRRRGRQLERQVEARTHELLAEKERAEAARSEAEQHREAAEHADRVKSEVLAIAAHDLKTPLQSILGFAELVKEETRPESRAAQHTRVIADSAGRMLEIVGSLLDMTALDEGRLVPEMETVDLGAVAARAFEAGWAAANRKSQRLTLQLAEEPLLVRGDEGRLVQVADNLLSNAIKYSPPGAAIELAVSRETDGIRLCVRDEGPGLSDADQERVFGRFQRLSARPTGDESTTGLGLYIVKRLVQLHGGAVRAESEGPGRGACFVVVLPPANVTVR